MILYIMSHLSQYATNLLICLHQQSAGVELLIAYSSCSSYPCIQEHRSVPNPTANLLAALLQDISLDGENNSLPSFLNNF